MANRNRLDPHVVVLGPLRKSYLPYLGDRLTVCQKAEDFAVIYRRLETALTWVSCSETWTDRLLASATLERFQKPKRSRPRSESILAIKSPRATSIPAIQGLFDELVGETPNYQWLPPDQLIEVLMAPIEERSSLFLGMATDIHTKTISLIRGNLRRLVVPFTLFPTSGDGIRPDFTRTKVGEYGHSLVFGDYEASADSILYEMDDEYRKKLKQQRQESEQTFGASLRRLRLQRGLSQADFPCIAPKTVARIERGEVKTVHPKTLNILATTLNVSADSLETY